MNVNILLLSEDAHIPTKAHQSDIGWDLYSIEDCIIKPRQRLTIQTGIAIEMPDQLAGLIWPRSGLAVKNGIDVLAGVIDAGYRGQIIVCLHNTSNDEEVQIKRGDRIAQMIFQEVLPVVLTYASTLNTSQRGENGFGSSTK